MKTFGRFVIRPAADGVRGDLILGAMFKDQEDCPLKPGTIYEIRTWGGEIILKPVGEAAIGDTREQSAVNVCWGSSIDRILDAGWGPHLMTKVEAELHAAQFPIQAPVLRSSRSIHDPEEGAGGRS